MAIPFLSTPDKPIVSTSQEFVNIADIVDGVVLLKNGGASLVMETTSLNFGLLSEREQRAVIAAYAGLLNSFTFPVQIVVRSQKKDISTYMNFFEDAEKKIKNAKLLNIMEDYKRFILDAIKKRNVLSKKFYIIIPFSPFELGLTKSFASALGETRGTTKLPFTKSYVLRKAKIALFPKRDHLMRQAGRLGLKFRHLTNNELIDLYFQIYNPEPPVKEKSIFSE